MVQTRSKRNLKSVPIRDLMIKGSLADIRRCKIKSCQKKIRFTPPIITPKEQKGLMTDLPIIFNEKRRHNLLDKMSMGTTLTLDTESFRITVHKQNKLLPTQIAYSIDGWEQGENGTSWKRKNLTKRMFYVGEIWANMKNREHLGHNSMFTTNTQYKHENHLEQQDYPIRGMKTIFAKMAKDMSKYNVSTICGFNLMWDFKAFSNALETFDPNNKHFDASLFNPFQHPHIKTCDLMHNAWRFYRDELTDTGVEKGIINQLGKKINKGKKGILSLSFLLDHFQTKRKKRKEKQLHLADTDTENTVFLLQEMMCDVQDTHKFEYNVVYLDKLFFYVHDYCQQKYGWALGCASKEEKCATCAKQIGRQVKRWKNTKTNQVRHYRCI